MCILTVNAGSSSLKLALYNDDLECFSGKNQPLDIMAETDVDLVDAVAWIVKDHRIAAVGHRVVHGGQRYDRPVLIDEGVQADLESYIPLAPLHQPPALRLIRLLKAQYPVPHVACFDTAWHRGRDHIADRFAIPEKFHHLGVQKYGFHGLSYEGTMDYLQNYNPEIARGRIVICHLGSGCSAASVAEGRPVDSTMGMSTFHGLPMSQRCGSIDAGAVLHLIRMGMAPHEVDRMLQKESGLFALSGGESGDMRKLLAMGSLRAGFAVDYFVNEVARAVSGFVPALGLLDTLVFTGGIGENSAEIRKRVCERLEYLGVRLNDTINECARFGRVDAPRSRVYVIVVPANEEGMIAKHTKRIFEAYRRD